MRFGIALQVMCTLCALTLCSRAHAEDQALSCTPENAVGEVISVQGKVEVLNASGIVLRALLPGTTDSSETERQFCAGETLRTGPLARATLAVREPPSVIRLDANTLLATVGYMRGTHLSNKPINGENEAGGVLDLCRRAMDNVWLDLKQGVLRLFTTEPTRLDIRTPYLNASVEGTEFSLLVTDDTAQVSVIDGVVGACNAYGDTRVRAGQTASAKAGLAPAIVDSENTVHWALHYPTLDVGIDGSETTIAALELIVAGRIFESLAILGNDADAADLALRSIIAITADERNRAHQLAQQAVKVNKKSPTAWTALSYVQQANYALEDALISATTAVEFAPQDASALARLAELEFILGNTANAETVAKKAVQFGPNLSRTHTVLGFISLDGHNMDAAATSFRKAIERDETDPLPRLGLGLVETRRGHRQQARSYLESAVSLNPESALLRVYLGRIYALDGRTSQAFDQFRLAEEIDDSDPLPHLYRAFVHHATNDTHEALIDLQTALDKNENRGVFRTRSLLDADLATALAARGRIYEEVGFNSLTLAEGTDALHRNPRDYAAHRLMADAYQFRPRHEIARASEQMQAQIRQPLNSNPVQLSLGLSRLDDFPDTGPRAVSFNEYTRLFSRQGFTSTLSTTNAPHDTEAAELQTNWLLPKTLASASFYRYQTDGLSFNRDGSLDFASLFLQRWFGRKLSAQIELSDSRAEQGADRHPRFNRDEYNKLDRFEDNRKRARIGLRWSYSEQAELFFNHDYSTLQRSLIEWADDNSQNDTDSSHTELQLAARTERTEQILGIGYSSQQAAESCRGSATTEASTNHSVAYGYLYPSSRYGDDSRIDYTLGVGLDDLNLRGVENRYISPKLGFVSEQGRFRWRSVLARTITRTLATNRTLEPTQIAGFSQLYDDFAGTVSTVAGIGAGMRLGPTTNKRAGDVYIDAELIHRHIDKPTASGGGCPPGLPDKTTEFEERRYTLGVYTSASPLSIALRFEHEEYISPDGARSQQFFVNSQTQRLAVEINAEINPHLWLTVTPQYIRQSGTFFNPFDEETYSGNDSFWTVDTALRVKLNSVLGKRISGSLGVEIANVFDTEFLFQESDPNVPSVSFERAVTARVQLNFD